MILAPFWWSGEFGCIINFFTRVAVRGPFGGAVADRANKNRPELPDFTEMPKSRDQETLKKTCCSMKAAYSCKLICAFIEKIRTDEEVDILNI